MGVRADITPQAARIDAHGYAREGATRSLHAGSAHVLPKNGTRLRAHPSKLAVSCTAATVPLLIA